jgi:GH24 family phage-related lysozyme (muramidase)
MKIYSFLSGKFFNSMLAGAALLGATAFNELDAAPINTKAPVTTMRAMDGWNGGTNAQTAVPFESYRDSLTIPFIMRFEGKIVDSEGNHVVYDDDVDRRVKRRWDGKGGKAGIQAFIKSCKGKPTIGYGETSIAIVSKGKISDSEARVLIQKRVNYINNKLNRQFKFYRFMNPNAKSALISFSYNLGSNFIMNKTVKMKDALSKCEWDRVCAEMADCNKSKGREVAGLTARRQAEMDLFKTPWE